MLMPPPPVVVDADVLIRNFEYFVKCGYPGALLGQASGNYSFLELECGHWTLGYHVVEL
jgi:hypothetical protein